jgi:pSer/pThr/pTyr-binding forkhead associated (FHA) protein
MRGRKVTLRDLGSANGTYVNNKRVNEVDLRAGDHVVVGPVVFTVQIDGQPSDVRPVKTKLARLKQQTAEAGADTSDMEAAAIFGDDMDTDPISALEALAGRQDDDEPPPPKK